MEGLEYHIGGGGVQYICLVGYKIQPVDGYVSVYLVCLWFKSLILFTNSFSISSFSENLFPSLGIAVHLGIVLPISKILQICIAQELKNLANTYFINS